MRFQVKAVRGQADIVDLAIEAFDAQTAERQAREQGYAVLTVKRASGFGARSGTRRSGLARAALHAGAHSAA